MVKIVLGGEEMKKIIKSILLCIATITIFSIIPSISNAATTKVTDEETLNSNKTYCNSKRAYNRRKWIYYNRFK